jgi:transketolase
MSDSIIPCRTVFTNTILEEAKKDKHIFVVTTDSRGSVTLENFAAELPGQFVELGIAEQNAVGVSAGIALCGNNVFVCGPACFYAARGLEQVKVDVAYTYANVKIVGVSGGVSYGALGSTHHSLHDISVMRTFPGLQVFLPADRFQTENLTRYLSHSSEPAYIRMGRNAVPDVYNIDDVFTPGQARTLLNGNDITIISCGETVFYALEAGKQLSKEGINARVIDMYSLKPIDSEAIVKAARETNHIVTVEEHSIYGGLGSIVAEIVSQHHPVKIKILGIPDENVINAKPLEIFDYYGLTTKNIISSAKELLT